jgi:flavin-dependent dehydrogenase
VSLDCDVAVVGGGPAGATAAITLAESGVHVALIERSLYEQVRIGETLPPAARPVLQQLGLVEAIAGAVPSLGTQSAWGSDDLATNPFIANPHGPGWHLDRARFDSALAGAAGVAGVTRLDGSEVTACAPSTRGTRGAWRLIVTTDGGAARRVTARAVVDATGRRASQARRLGARRRLHDRLVGLAVHYSGPDDPPGPGGRGDRDGSLPTGSSSSS